MAVTSKIISYCQGSLIEKKRKNINKKHKIVKQEADLYLEPHSSKYNLMLTVKNYTLAVYAGVDESNADGYYVLWPKDLQETANSIWKFLRTEYQLKYVGVVITDSKTTPYRWGVTGTCIAHCGFKALIDWRGKPDLFGYHLTMVQVNIAESVASAAVFEMGEVAEQTPLAVVKQIKDIEFQDRVPSNKELQELIIEMDDDVYAPLLQKGDWQKGGE